jgi:hypothetical protein
VRRILLMLLASIVPATLCIAETNLGWPEVIALLAKAKTQATLAYKCSSPTATRPPSRGPT